MALLPILSALGSGLSAMGGSSSETDSSMESTTTGQSSIDRSELSPKLIKALQSMFSKQNLNTNFRRSRRALNSQVGEIQATPDFDIEKFVNGIMTQANNTVGNQLAEATNLVEADTGGTQGTNSMSALLGNKLATDSAAQLAGIEAQATAEGTKIRNDQLDSQAASIIGLTGASNKTFTDFLTLLRGAKTSQKQKTKEHTVGSSTSTTDQGGDILAGLGGFLGGFKAPT